jgi:hypothetical protein
MRHRIVILMLCVARLQSADIISDSPSLADVTAAVDSANDGDTVLIPNGYASWNDGISTTKQIIIRAQTYTPTKYGSANRNVVITNNSSNPLLHLKSGESFHVGVGGIRFNEGSGSGNHIRYTGSGSKVPLLFDCALQCKQRNGSATDVAIITVLSAGGVMWNCYVTGEGFPGGAGGSGPDGASIYVRSTHRAWTTADTMGDRDISGDINMYIEDSTMFNVGQCPDIEDRARVVIRSGYYDGSWGLTHGFTGVWGGRHWEIYDMQFDVTDPDRAIASRYFWCRAGTGIFTDCVVNNHVNPSEWGASKLLQIGDNTAPVGEYPIDRQPGGGHDGVTYIVDPIYIWGNSGSRAYSYNYNTTSGNWDDFVLLDRDIFVNSSAKPAYVKFLYPHPFRSAIEGNPGRPKVNPKGKVTGKGKVQFR